MNPLDAIEPFSLADTSAGPPRRANRRDLFDVFLDMLHALSQSEHPYAYLADPDKARSISAGLDAVDRVQPEVIEVMREVGLDLTGVQPTELTGRMLTELNFLVTLGCAERCPTIAFSRRQDWRLKDPSGRSLDEVRAIRDEIHALVTGLVNDKEWARAERPRPRLVTAGP